MPTCTTLYLIHLCTWYINNFLFNTHTHTRRSGVVLTFYSNQQSFDSLESVHVAVNTATDHGVQFAEDLITVCP